MFEKFVVMDKNVSNGYFIILEIIKKKENQNYREDLKSLLKQSFGKGWSYVWMQIWCHDLIQMNKEWREIPQLVLILVFEEGMCGKKGSTVIGGVYELIIQGCYSKNHYKKDVNSMINTKSKLIGGGEKKG